MGTRDARFERLYRDYAGRVKAYALRRGAGPAADDVVADVFLIAWRRLDDVPEAGLPWLLGVARRVLANRRRGEGRFAALAQRLAGELGSDGATEQARGAAPQDARVLEALATLSDGDRELLMLVAWEGLETAEVAEVLAVRPNTVSVRLHRARRRLAAALDAESSDALEVGR